jgi:NADP-dependent aldehyde dehydrogenase
MLHGWSHDVGVAMVQHPITRAVGFTGSLRGGRALFDAAAGRPEPIPVYAEMGSVNPVFVFPSALDERMDAIVHGLALSITAGVGQFCTNPGVVVAMRGGALDRFIAALAAKLGAEPEGVMLYERLGAAFAAGVARAQSAGATILAGGGARAGTGETHVRPTLLVVDADDFIEHAELRDEVFGPVSLVVRVADAAEMERVAAALEGQLTATIHGTSADLREQASLVEHLRRRVGRLLFNGFPTGVEVGHAMHHGGPYPASSDARTTSVGTAAITRFARPVCYQNFPDDALPEALRSRNELGIWRMIDGGLTKAHV